MELKRVRLKELRKKAKLTQEQLAEILETRQSVISQMERGFFTPSIDMALKILTVLRSRGVECGLDDFYEYGDVEGKMTANSATLPARQYSGA